MARISKQDMGGRLPCRNCGNSLKGYPGSSRYCSTNCRDEVNLLPNKKLNNKTGEIDPYWLRRGIPSYSSRGYIVAQET